MAKRKLLGKKLKVVFLSISSCQADFYILLKLQKLFFNRSFWKFQKIPRNTLVVKQSYKSAIPQFYSIALYRGVFLENFPNFQNTFFIWHLWTAAFEFMNDMKIKHWGQTWRSVASLRKKCPYSELFCSAFSTSPYSVRMRENADQNNYAYGHFSRSPS